MFVILGSKIRGLSISREGTERERKERGREKGEERKRGEKDTQHFD